MRRPPNSGRSKQEKKTSRTDTKVGVKPVAQIPIKPRTSRKLTFVVFDGDENGNSGEDPFLPISFAESKNRGPKALYRGDILRFRDRLVMVVEAYWPELQTALRTPVDEAALLHLLTAIHRKSQTEASEHVVNCVDSLIELIKKNRVRNDPRQVANALAGLPNITIITSLKRCGRKKNRCEIAIGQRARRAYIERRHPRLARMLSLLPPEDLSEYAPESVEGIATTFVDPNIYLGKNRAKGLRGIWESGIPDLEMLIGSSPSEQLDSITFLLYLGEDGVIVSDPNE